MPRGLGPHFLFMNLLYKSRDLKNRMRKNKNHVGQSISYLNPPESLKRSVTKSKLSQHTTRRVNKLERQSVKTRNSTLFGKLTD